jgi:hypothetical protein
VAISDRVKTGAEHHDFVDTGLKLGQQDLVDRPAPGNVVAIGARSSTLDSAHEQWLREPVLDQARDVEAAEDRSSECVWATNRRVAFKRAGRTNRRSRLGGATRCERIAGALAESHDGKSTCARPPPDASAA